MFLPTTREECRRLGWSSLDVILVSGDAYIDSPLVGVAVIGNVLAAAGFRVGLVAQPRVDAGIDIIRLGVPELFWGVTGGAVDSMVANHTAGMRPRRRDDFTAGGINNRRPDRAVIIYANLIRRFARPLRPIVLGGIEASLRRISHYDAWNDRVRRSILFDAKADYLVYGMGEATTLALARRLAAGRSAADLPGLCYIAHQAPEGFVRLPDHQAVVEDPVAFNRMFARFARHNRAPEGIGLCQRQDNRFLVQNPPAPPMTAAELDAVHDLDYRRAVHPAELARGPVRALDTIAFSLVSHRGCFGGCAFCAISAHQGCTVVSRSIASLVEEARRLAQHPDFRGTIADVGGPTANMYAMGCTRAPDAGPCRRASCLYPTVCAHLDRDHAAQVALLDRLASVDAIRNVFVASGIRHDLLLADGRSGDAYLKRLVRRHTSGQLKVAPEHVVPEVLGVMGKPGPEVLEAFTARFQKAAAGGPKRFLTYYFMAAHPGCRHGHMLALRDFARRRLRLRPEQVQVFTPTPSTRATAIFHTGHDPFTGEPVFVERRLAARVAQKAVVLKP
ncbi:MAG: YgiQ family radical SAM protein [Deltaproteobacteria bacterium]|nr:YgiQ family radical SAM protein [Deltaproteobacteria bacterium]